MNMEDRISEVAADIVPRRKPSTLYHYTSAAGLLGILRTKSIWATNIGFLNDTKEFALALDIAREVLAQRGPQSHTDRFELALYEILRDRLEHVESTNVFVTSFSENGDQLSQWRGYCPAASGYAIGIAPRDLTTSGEGTGQRYLARWTYAWDKQRDLVDRIIDQVVQFAADLSAAPHIGEDRVHREAFKLFGTLLALIAPVIKHHTFREESEWRLISLRHSFTEPHPLFRVGHSMIVPYFEVKLTRGKAPLHLREIIIGPTPHPQLAQRAVDELLVKHDITKVDLRGSAIPFRDW